MENKENENKDSLAGTTESNSSEKVDNPVEGLENQEQSAMIEKITSNENNPKNDNDTIFRILSDLYSILSKGNWCVCITFFDNRHVCGKLLRQNDKTNPYSVIIVLSNEFEKEIEINLADVKQIKQCSNEVKRY